MEAQAPINEYRLVFKSKLIPAPKAYRKEDDCPTVRETRCIIYVGEGEIPAAFGIATQHVMDQDNKFIGQKRALEKALRNFAAGDVNKDIRKEIWGKFFRRSQHGCDLIGIPFPGRPSTRPLDSQGLPDLRARV